MVEEEEKEHTTYAVGPLSYTRMVQAIREGMGESLREHNLDYIADHNFHFHPDKNAQFTLEGNNPFVSPATFTRWGNANQALQLFNNNYYLNYVDAMTLLYSKKLFKYGAFGFQLRLPNPANAEFNYLFVGAEPTRYTPGGLAAFYFDNPAGAIRTILWTNAMQNYSFLSPAVVSTFHPGTPNDGLYNYLVKVNRASVEYYIREQIVGIVQFAPNSDEYDVRTTTPYYLAQFKGQTPCFNPALIEWGCKANNYVGRRSGIQLQTIYVTDGDPAPPRTLHPIVSAGTGATVGANWEGTTITAGTLTSDRVPVAGYRDRTLLLDVTVQGTLSEYVDYGDDVLNLVNSWAVAANSPRTLSLNENGLWEQFIYEPDSFNATVTRARVKMRD